MIQGITLFIYPVTDLAQAKTLFSKLLGIQPYFGFKVGDQEIGLDPNGHDKGMMGPSATGTLTISRKVCNYSLTPVHNHRKRSKTLVGVS